VPVVIGLLTAMLYQHVRAWKWSEILLLMVANLTSATLLGLMCLLEGVVCIVMAAFLVAAMTLLGILIAWAVQAIKRRNHLNCLAILSLPFLMHWEDASSLTAPLLEHSTHIEINVPPEVVWQFILEFPAIQDAPKGWLSGNLKSVWNLTC